MLDNITRSIGLFVGASMILYLVTKPKTDFEPDLTEATMTFKGAKRYSPAAMRQSTMQDEMDMQ